MKASYLVLLFVLASAVWGQPPDTVWTRRFSTEDYEFAFGLDKTYDNGLVMCGSASDAPDQWSYAVIRKVDHNGIQQWQKQIGGGNTYCEATDIIQATDSSIITVGYNVWSLFDQIFFTKHSLSGDSLASYNMGVEVLVNMISVTETTDRGYCVLGTERLDVFSGFSARVTEFSQNGTYQWTRRYGRGSQYRVDAMDIAAMPDGGFVIAAHFKRLFTTDSTTLLMIRADANGDTLWTRELAASSGSLEAVSVCVTENEQLVFSCDWDGPQFKWFIIWVDFNGDTTQTREYLDTRGSSDFMRVVPARESGFVGCGYWRQYPSFASLARLDSSGNVLWHIHYGIGNNEYGGADAVQLRDGGYAMLTEVTELSTFMNPIVLVRFQSDDTQSTVPPMLPDKYPLLSCYPNPFNSSTRIEYDLQYSAEVVIDLYNVQGELVANIVNGYRNTGKHAAMIEAVGLSSGIYFCRLNASGAARVQKLILLR